jgi:hypothetical protein
MSQGTRGIVRGAMLMVWCLVVWGSLIVLATGWAALTRGSGAALGGFARLSAINQALALAALVAWGLAAWALLDARRERDAA